MSFRVAGPSAGARRSVETAIRFGTSGWRGALGEEVTFPRLRVLVRSVVDWIRSEGHGDRVLIGWDRRFASREMAEITARVVRAEGLRALLATEATPTPAITHALARGGGAAGLVLTASHNPPQDHGLKVFGPEGGSIVDAEARRIEAIALERMAEGGPAAEPDLGPHADLGERSDFNAAYRTALAGMLDGDALDRSGITVVYDAMHGCGSGVLDRVLSDAGVRVRGLRLARDPLFGGGAPDPAAPRLRALAEAVAATPGCVLGLATDGDGDRIGAVDGRGRLLSETQVVAVLVDHLARSGRVRKGIAISAGTGSILERLAAEHGLPLERHPVGFKHLSAAIRQGRADVAGEESGGFALAELGCDKDGILAGCLLAELVATSLEPLEVHVARLEERFGGSACGRAAIATGPALERALATLAAAPPERIGPARVVAVDDRFGLRFALEDGGFVILRRSGTEPVLRIYAEAGDAAALAGRLDAARGLLERVAGAA